MIYWITGRKNSGKTTLAYRMAKQVNGVVLDGDEFRSEFSSDFTDDGRWSHLQRITRVACILEAQGFPVIIACVSPKRVWRKELQAMFKECIEICMPFGELWDETIFEEPEE